MYAIVYILKNQGEDRAAGGDVHVRHLHPHRVGNGEGEAGGAQGEIPLVEGETSGIYTMSASLVEDWPLVWLMVVHFTCCMIS